MRRMGMGRALGTTGGAVALGLVVASPASAAAFDWELQYKLDRAEENRITEVDAVAADSVWAVGRQGPWDTGKPVAFYYDGTTWQELESPQERGVTLTHVDATSSGSAWITVDDSDAGGGDDAVMHWNDDGWDTHRFPGSAGGDVAALSDTDVWYVAGGSDGAVARHYDGAEWTSTTLPGGGDVSISAVQARSGDDVWAVGRQGDQPYAAHWDGTSWQVVSPDEVTPPPGDDEFAARLTDVAFVGGQVWAVGLGTGDTSARGLFYRFDGGEWQPRKLPDIEYGVGATSVGQGPDGTVWLANDDGNLLYRRTSSGWAKVSVPEEPRTATGVLDFTTAGGEVWVSGTSEVSDVEYHGVIYHAT